MKSLFLKALPAVLAGSALIAGARAFAADPATTQDVQQQLQALQAKVAQLEAQQQQSDQATVKSVLTDAEKRSQLMADSVDISLDVTGWDTDLDRIHKYDASVQRIEREGVAPLLERLRSLRTRAPDSLANAAYDVDQIARTLQQRGRAAEAIAMFQFSAESFDNQSNAHAALARADGCRKRVSVAGFISIENPGSVGAW